MTPSTISGVLLSYVWFILIKSYKDLNSVRFKVINEIEKDLPISPYYMEWEIIKKEGKYLSFTTVERYVPLIFGIIHIVIIIIKINKVT